MIKNDNPFQDLIDLYYRYEKSIKVKTALIDKTSEDVEKRKKMIFEMVTDFERKSIHIPDCIDGFIQILVEKVEERKQIRNNWGSLGDKRVEMDKYCEGLEKMLIERGEYKPTTYEKQEIELLIKQYEEISIKQESILINRIEIQEEEITALNEIDRILAAI